jgi:hypothetical protein
VDVEGMARLGGEGHEGDAMTNPHDTPELREKFTTWWNQLFDGDFVLWNDDGPEWPHMWDSWTSWLACRAANAPEVAELVGLLRKGRELYEAACEEGFQVYGVPEKHKAARDRTREILDQYDAAIAKHGGNA